MVKDFVGIDLMSSTAQADPTNPLLQTPLKLKERKYFSMSVPYGFKTKSSLHLKSQEGLWIILMPTSEETLLQVQNYLSNESI